MNDWTDEQHRDAGFVKRWRNGKLRWERSLEMVHRYLEYLRTEEQAEKCMFFRKQAM